VIASKKEKLTRAVSGWIPTVCTTENDWWPLQCIESLHIIPPDSKGPDLFFDWEEEENKTE
jgi:hypothetical protein